MGGCSFFAFSPAGIRALVFFAGAVGPVSFACQTHQCDADFVCVSAMGQMRVVSDARACDEGLGSDAASGTPIAGYSTTVFATSGVDGGELLVWNTSPLSGPWLDYPGQRTFIINFPPGLAGHTPSNISSALSADNPPDPESPHKNFIVSPGYLTEFSNVGNNQLRVFNPSCARYALRIQVQAEVAASARDANVSDANVSDANAPDANAPDANAPDANAPDSANGQADGGLLLDAGSGQ